MDEVKDRHPAVERILQQAREMDREPEGPELRDAFDEVRNPKRHSRQAILLDVRKTDGQRIALSYSLLSRVHFEPGDRMKIHFGSDVVQLQGRQLEKLYVRLLEHRVEAIHEGTEWELDGKPDDATHIDRIELITATEADHDDH